MDTRNITYMFYGFAAIWAILVIYVGMLVARERDLKRELAGLKHLLDERK
ncbi:MAG: CcmD family protein [Acidobacteria bacterium]|nr:CcmD family protein [Acidobacteriota bacterium]